MCNPWDRPANSQTPNRQGDADSEPIYSALGHAVSAWEGVGAAMSAVFFAMLPENERQEIDCTKLDQFGDLNNVHKRVKQLQEAWDSFALADFGSKQTEVTVISERILKLKPAIRGWAERRNDLAHG